MRHIVISDSGVIADFSPIDINIIAGCINRGGILLTCLQKVSSIFLQSMGRPLQSTLLSLARDVVFFVPALLFLAPRYGVEGMLWAAPIADVLAGILAAVLVASEMRRLTALENAPHKH